jgi:hypothetical protein
MLLASRREVMRSLTAFATAFCSLVILAATGCSTGPSAASATSVTIDNHTPEEIAAVTTQVFTADGYRAGLNSAKNMVFEKEASRATTFMREGIVDTQAGAQTVIRVRAQVVRLADNKYRLQCQPFMVTGGSDPFFQEESRVSNLRSGPYQSLLDKVKQQLP